MKKIVILLALMSAPAWAQTDNEIITAAERVCLQKPLIQGGVPKRGQFAPGYNGDNPGDIDCKSIMQEYQRVMMAQQAKDEAAKADEVAKSLTERLKQK